MNKLVNYFDSFVENDISKKIICVGCPKDYILEISQNNVLCTKVSLFIDKVCRNEQVALRDNIYSFRGYQTLCREDFYNKAILILDDYYEEKYNELIATFPFLTEEVIYFYPNFETRIEFRYRKAYMKEPLQDMILFRSGPHASEYIPGMDFSDNARALFEYMLHEKLNTKYQLIWLVKNPEEYKQYYQEPNVHFIAYDWSVSPKLEEQQRYYRALCLSKYIFFTDAYGFARNARADQVRVQLWHGCGFKTRVNFTRCEHRYEYTTVVSSLYAKIHADIYGLRADQVLVTGYAKEDWLFHKDKGLFEKLEIPEADKYIFWLPTFRTTGNQIKHLDQYNLVSETGLPVLSTESMLKNMNEILKETNNILIVKLHPFQKADSVVDLKLSNIFFLSNQELYHKDIQINQLLANADALISDYSSAAVDFLLLDRPIAFLLDDMDRYEESRGFVFDNILDWLPGMEIYTPDELYQFVQEVSTGRDSTKEKRRRIKKEMHEFDDDHSCYRILKQLGIL